MDLEERVDEVSADLPYELQSKMFDQLATVSLGGAGLAVTLIGSLLRSASAIVWLPVVLFGLAAVFAVQGNIKLIDGLFHKRAVLQRSKFYAALAVGLTGMAIGENLRTCEQLATLFKPRSLPLKSTAIATLSASSLRERRPPISGCHTVLM